MASYWFQSALLLPFAGGAVGGLFLFVDQTVYRLHPCLPGSRAGAGSHRRLARRERDLCGRALFLLRFDRWCCWLVGFDIIYALQDYEFDRRHGLHSLVVAWGPANALRAAFLAHMFMWGLLFLFGLLSRFRVAYLVGWLSSWLSGARTLAGAPTQFEWINTAFFRLNALISVIFLVDRAAEVAFRGSVPGANELSLSTQDFADLEESSGRPAH